MSRTIGIKAVFKNGKTRIIAGMHKSQGCEYKESLFSKMDLKTLESQLEKFRHENKEIKKILVKIELSNCNNNAWDKTEPLDFTVEYNTILQAQKNFKALFDLINVVR